MIDVNGSIRDSSGHSPLLKGRQSDARVASGCEALTVDFFPSNAVTRRTACWGDVTGEIIEANQRGRLECRLRSSLHMLAIHERGVREAGRTSVQGLSASDLRDCRRKLVFVPAGHEYHEWQEPRTLSRIAYFYFDPARFERELDLAGVIFTPRIFFEDSSIWDTGLKLIALIDSGLSDNRRYAEALYVVLTHELARLDRSPAGRGRGGLAAWQRQRVIAYIGEHLSAPIPLAKLASLANLSPNYFCRAFRQSFGMPPQQYQISQRIERAKTLLEGRGASVTDIGLTVGYSETSAFSTAFRRVTGISPSAYRIGSI